MSNDSDCNCLSPLGVGRLSPGSEARPGASWKNDADLPIIETLQDSTERLEH